MASKRLRRGRFTKEYTALRVLFQKESYRLAFIETAYPGWIGFFSRDNIEVHGYAAARAKERLASELIRLRQEDSRLARVEKTYEAKYWIQKLHPSSRVEVDKYKQTVKDAKQKVGERQQEFEAELAAFESFKKSLRIARKCDCKFDVDGADVQIDCHFDIVPHGSLRMGASWKGRNNLSFESKVLRIWVESTVSDNYPAIRRQMEGRARYLFLGAYEGQGATPAEFEADFLSAGITVVNKTAVDAALAARSVAET
jgi:hypothetical protein